MKLLQEIPKTSSLNDLSRKDSLIRLIGLVGIEYVSLRLGECLEVKTPY